MNNRENTMSASFWGKSVLWLVLFSLGQVTPSYHFHHIHDNHVHKAVFSEIEKSSHIAAHDHDSNHQHSDESPPADEHQHTFDKRTYWHLARTQTSASMTGAGQFILPTPALADIRSEEFSKFGLVEILSVADSPVSNLIIRGPPLQV
ncbi:hypothetical protein JYU19_02635 [bacterium AH-315-J21]|nr:hypothetical protein [bacterium AH-315-J21]